MAGKVSKASNVPAELEDKFQSCKDAVMSEDGMTEDSAYAICYTSVVEGKSLDDARAAHAGKAEDVALVEDVEEVEEIDAVEPEARMNMLEVALRDILTLLNSIGIKLGARHSKADNETIQNVHDLSLQLGAMCTGKAKSAFGVCKGKDGNFYGLGVFTNCYEDLDGEIIRDSAHKQFAAYLDANPTQAPELWTWHEPGTARKSRANWWDYDGTFFFMQWPLTETEAKSLARVGPLSMSHQFNGVKEGREWVSYITFEASVLAEGAEANPLTSFEAVMKERSIMFDPKKRELFVQLHGEEFTAEKEAASGKARAEADAAGLKRKEAEAAQVATPTPSINLADALAQLTAITSSLVTQVAAMQAEQKAISATVKTLQASGTLEAIERKADERAAWLTSPRVPSIGIAEQAKTRGQQLTAEDAAKSGVAPLENWLRPNG